MNNVEFRVFSKDKMPDIKEAGDISCLFCANYPDMYPEDLRESDVSRYDTSEKIQDQIRNGNFYITGRVRGELVGMSKFRKEESGWLGSWIMVKDEFRNKGVGEQLFHKSYDVLQDLKVKGEEAYLILDIHKKNAPSIALFERMGFEKEEGKSDRYWRFRKEIVDK